MAAASHVFENIWIGIVRVIFWILKTSSEFKQTVETCTEDSWELTKTSYTTAWYLAGNLQQLTKMVVNAVYLLYQAFVRRNETRILWFHFIIFMMFWRETILFMFYAHNFTRFFAIQIDYVIWSRVIVLFAFWKFQKISDVLV